MTLAFKYKELEFNRKTPSIPIIIKESMTFHAIALLDSGADCTCIPKSLAKELGPFW